MFQVSNLQYFHCRNEPLETTFSCRVVCLLKHPCFSIFYNIKLTTQPRDSLLFEPLCQWLLCIPVTVLSNIVPNNKRWCPDFVRLKCQGQIIFIPFFFRNAIIPYKRVGQDQDLGPVRRICQGLGVAHHTSLEYCRKRRRLNKAWEHHNIRKTWTSIMWKYFSLRYICVSVKPHPIISEVAEFLGTQTKAAFPGIKASELLYNV